MNNLRCVEGLPSDGDMSVRDGMSVRDRMASRLDASLERWFCTGIVPMPDDLSNAKWTLA